MRDHGLTLHRDNGDGQWAAKCTCGWYRRNYYTKRDAIAAHAAHGRREGSGR